jgi:hypothetical protein
MPAESGGNFAFGPLKSKGFIPKKKALALRLRLQIADLRYD